MAAFAAKLTSFLEFLLIAALYFGAAALTVCAAGDMAFSGAGAFSFRQAIVTELLLVTPAYLSMTYRCFRWLRLPCCLYLGSATGAFLVVSGFRFGWLLLLSRFLLALVMERRQGGSLQFAVLTVIGAALKYLG